MAVYGFGPFVLDMRERRLLRDGQPLPVAGKSLEVLGLLAEAGGRLVERETFTAQLWPDVTVEDRNLTVHISTLRKALNGHHPSVDCIETVAKAGYRMALPVQLLGPADPPASLPPPSGLHFIKAEARANLNKVERVPALRALGLFERALALDPNDADCHAGMASTYLLMTSTTIRRPLPIDEAMPLARDAAHRALVLDETNGEARGVLGRLRMIYERDWAGAEAELARAVALAPQSPDAAFALALFLLATSRPDEAVANLARARRLDPLRRDIIEHLGLAHWMAAESEPALAALAEAVSIDPEARRPHFRRMLVLDQLGRHDEAMAERRIWLELFDHAPFAARLDGLMQTDGHRAAMLEWIAMLERLNQWYEVAIQRMVIDDITGALDALERALSAHADSVVYMGAYPSFHPLRGEPRYQRLVQQLGLAKGQQPGAASRRG
ncbi:MAG: winged helix-turn-helix domain-containing protein [Reyranella sp.]|nr:winged helix-turn-helix domain-containing protein [Reyranella sp.]